MSHPRLPSIGFGIGSQQGGVTLFATCTPFDAIPPANWEGFKLAVQQAAAGWGLKVRISEHPSIQDAKNTFFQHCRIHDEARARADSEAALMDGDVNG